MERWEDALDVDDSDLPTLLRPSATLLPCNNRPNPNPNPNPSRCEVQTQTLTICSQSQNPQTLPDSNPNPSSGSSDRTGRLIPGPAGAIQASMLRQNAQSGNSSRIRDDGILINEFPDGDFNGNPWLCALDFLGLEAGSGLQHTIESTWNMERVPQIVGIIKSCTSNGLGDLVVTLKDPTGTIGASIHHKVLAESMSGMDISVDSVVILKQVVAFSPTRSSRYLNVTRNNVVKLNQPSFSFVLQLLIFGQTVAEGIGQHSYFHFKCQYLCSRPTFQQIISKNSGPPPKRSFPASKVSCPVLEEHMETRPAMAEVTSFRKGADEVANGSVWRDPGNGEGMPAGRRPEDAAGGSNFSSTILRKAYVVKEPFLHETCGRNGVKKLIPKVSVADWTDEQLLELFPEDE
ncbi:hypothetical protein CKAN_02513600 [Cinnamomum micranthum f. kanehirae]|uniref:Homologous recombination OB-fold protein OB-fold domain-containing protein n=1 Tax=Cinnamomum micranthum f. kanehirae TaxID=337451 RepID=A0A443PYF6_9MAGN|nr:hypothetical protein CKAN_02513600 [Cinnamomum micranthum f. kanehirae]